MAIFGFNKDGVRRIVRAVRRVEAQGVGLGTDVPTPRRPITPGSAMAHDIETHNARAGSVVWIKAYDEDQRWYDVQQCDYSALSSIGVLADHMDSGGEQSMWVQGAPAFKVLVSDYTDLDTTKFPRIGAQAGSYFAMADRLGPMIACEDVAADEQVTPPEEIDGFDDLPSGVGLVWAVLTPRVGDYLCVDTGNADTDGFYRNVVWSADYALAQTDFGVTEVSMT